MKGNECQGIAKSRVNPNSTTPTHVAMKFLIDNWRWQGVFVPRDCRKVSEIAIQFREVLI